MARTKKENCQKRGKYILEVMIVAGFLRDAGKGKSTYDNSRGTGDMNSCLAQLETAAENDIPVIVFDSNVSEDQLIADFYGSANRN